MLRPLDQALIDFEKTYRQIFKQPLAEHEQYTKRQLLYNYAAIGSQCIEESLKRQQSLNSLKKMDLQQIIDQWNDSTLRTEKIGYEGGVKLDNWCGQQEEQQKTLKKQIQVLKKEKMIVKHKSQRNVYFRKEMQVLFRTRNINMLSVDSMRSHFNQLKAYISYNSKNRGRNDSEKFAYKLSEENKPALNRGDSAKESARWDQQRENAPKNQDRQEKINIDFRKSHPYSRDFSQKSESFDKKRPENLSPANTTYYNPEKYRVPSSAYPPPQFTKSNMTYSKYLPRVEPTSGHNQNYQSEYVKFKPN